MATVFVVALWVVALGVALAGLGVSLGCLNERYRREERYYRREHARWANKASIEQWRLERTRERE